jgi:hypothetical protein
MKNRKIDELSYKIYSDRFNYEVHHNIDNFRYIISDLVNVIDTFNSSFLNIDINKLPKVKQNEIYNYKILLVEEQIKKIKEDYYDFQKNRQIV